MPVFTAATAMDLPGKRLMASAMPRGTPSKSEIAVALPEILNESPVIDHTSGSKPSTSSAAFQNPCQISSTLDSQIFLFLSRHRHEQRLSELFHAKGFDHVLGLRRDQEISKSLAAGGVDARAIGRVDFEN